MRYAMLASCVIAIGCGTEWVEGNGDFATQTRDLTAFAALDVSDNVHAYVSVDPAAPDDRTLITVSGDENVLEKVYLDVNSMGALVVSTGDDIVEPRIELRISMTIHRLIGLRVADDGFVFASNVTASHFNLEETDRAAIFINGTVDALDADLSGGALLDARDLRAKIVFVHLLDEAHANVCATEKLMTDVEDSTRLDIYCDPANVTP